MTAPLDLTARQDAARDAAEDQRAAKRAARSIARNTAEQTNEALDTLALAVADRVPAVRGRAIHETAILAALGTLVEGQGLDATLDWLEGLRWALEPRL